MPAIHWKIKIHELLVASPWKKPKRYIYAYTDPFGFRSRFGQKVGVTWTAAMISAIWAALAKAPPYVLQSENASDHLTVMLLAKPNMYLNKFKLYLMPEGGGGERETKKIRINDSGFTQVWYRFNTDRQDVLSGLDVTTTGRILIPHRWCSCAAKCDGCPEVRLVDVVVNINDSDTCYVEVEWCVDVEGHYSDILNRRNIWSRL